MPLVALLCVLSCLGSCCGNYCNHDQPSWVRNVAQVTPSALAYVWDSSPIFLRLWSWTLAREDPAMLYHIGQVVFFLSSGFFFTCPLPERCFPGRCDFLGQSHQLFHVLISCCTLSQIHATYLDFVGRRDVYRHLHKSYEATLFLGLYVFTLLACTLVVAFMLRKIQQSLDAKNKHS